MINVVIVHGKGGSLDSSWLAWLKEKLNNKEFKSIIPTFPSENDSKLDDWFKIFNNLGIDLSKSIFVAHARGAMALLRWINTLPPETLIPKVITVSCNFDFQPHRTDSNEFYSSKLNYDDIKKKVQRAVIIHSSDDPYVPIEAGSHLAEKLNAKFVHYKTAGHFGSDKKEAPEILREIVNE